MIFGSIIREWIKADREVFGMVKPEGSSRISKEETDHPEEWRIVVTSEIVPE